MMVWKLKLCGRDVKFRMVSYTDIDNGNSRRLIAVNKKICKYTRKEIYISKKDVVLRKGSCSVQNNDWNER